VTSYGRKRFGSVCEIAGSVTIGIMILIIMTLTIMKLSIMTLIIMTLIIMTLSIMTLSIMTLIIMTLIIMTHIIKTNSEMTISIMETKHNARMTFSITALSRITKLSIMTEQKYQAEDSQCKDVQHYDTI
jgi:hypothetical protein